MKIKIALLSLVTASMVLALHGCSTKVDNAAQPVDKDIALYQGRPLQPWHIVIDNQGNNQLLNGAFARLSDETITITTSDKLFKDDALTVKFEEAWDGEVYMSHGRPLDLTQYIEKGTLAFDFNSIDMKSANLQTSINCGDNCNNVIDLWPYAKEFEGKGWQKVAIPLSCFASSRADFSAVAKPFAITFSGTGEFSFSNITITRESTANFDCPNQDTLTTHPQPLRAFWADEWWPNRVEEKKTTQSGDEKLLLVGDSITHGWEQDSGQAVWQKHFSDVSTLNLGFGGNRTENVLWLAEQGLLDNLNAKLTVIMIGTNNTGHRMDSPESIHDGVKAIVQTVTQKIPTSKVLLLAIFPRGTDDNDKLRINNQKTNVLLKKLAKNQGILFADINASFLTKDKILSKDIMPDLLHPNAKGYEIWAQQLTPYVDKYVR